PLSLNEPKDLFRTNQINMNILGTTEQKSTIKVNDQPVNLAGIAFKSTITLVEGDNEIHVESCDLAGNCAHVYVSGFLDTIPPALEVTSPEDGSLTNQMAIEISGTTEPEAEVTVNQRDADVFGTEWSYFLELREGKNSIKVEALDDVGNKATINLIVNRDTKPPSILIDSPDDGIVVPTPIIRLEGMTDVSASVTVNDVKVNNVAGSFSTDVKLVEGENTIKVVAVDGATNSASESITITLDTTVELALDDLKEDTPIETQDETINISGQVDPDATVVINGALVKVGKDGKFSEEVELEVGENEIMVNARDPLGNDVTYTYKVVRKDPPPPKPTGPMDIGGGIPLGSLLIPLLLIIIIIVVVVALAMRSKKRKAAEESEASIPADTTGQQPITQGYE
ncbi:MAG: hypothetical protein KAX80_14145, partial [Planctomycetes bacterium]|nr:hypothetical protein [Planctomycetota bacterium]